MAEVDAEVADARRTTPATGSGSTATPTRRRPARTPAATGAAARKGGGHRLPDLSALPPLLAATGTFADLARTTRRDRRRPAQDGPPCRAGGGAARCQELSRGGDRAGGRRRATGLDRARRGDRRPRGRGAGGVAGRSGGGDGPRAADGPRLRAQRAHRRRDGRPCRGPRCLARRPGAGDGGQRPGAPPAHDRPGRPAGRPARAAARCPDPPGRAPARAVRPRLRARHRGRGPGRIRAARRHRRRLPAVPVAADPDRVLRRRDRFAALLRPDRPAHGRHDRAGPPPARLRVPAAGRWRDGDPRPARPRRGQAPGTAGGRPRPVRHRGPGPHRRTRPRCRRQRPGDGRRRCGRGLGRAPRAGDGSRPHRAGHAPRSRRAGRHRRGRGVPVAPGRRAPGGARRVRRAAEGVAADLPPAARLEGPAGRLPDPRADLGIRAGRGCRDGPRCPVVRRSVRLARARPATRPRRTPAGCRGRLAGG